MTPDAAVAEEAPDTWGPLAYVVPLWSLGRCAKLASLNVQMRSMTTGCQTRDAAIRAEQSDTATCGNEGKAEKAFSSGARVGQARRWRESGDRQTDFLHLDGRLLGCSFPSSPQIGTFGTSINDARLLSRGQMREYIWVDAVLLVSHSSVVFVYI